MRRQLGAALPALVSLVAVAAVVWWALRQDAPPLPRSGSALAVLLAALAVYALGTAARGERWHRILERSGILAERGEAFRLTTVGYMGNNVLPARGGDLLRVFLLSPLARVSKRAALGTVVAERLLDAVALGLLFLVVAAGLLPDTEVPGVSRAVVLALFALALLALAVAALARRFAPERVREFGRPLAAATRNLASAHGTGLLALSVAIWILEALVYLIVALALGLELDLFGALYVVAVTNLFALVPAAPGYVGTFDAAVLFAVGSLGADGPEALAYLLVLRFVLFVPITLVGLLLFVTRYGGWTRYRTTGLEPTEV
jgi:uncharacterized protein (TIRG00374 family)